MTSPFVYASALVRRAGKAFLSGEIFAKVLTKNDDSGRHGVLIPTDIYSFFPQFEIPEKTRNATMEFSAFSANDGIHELLTYKYYERYPERRVTRLHDALNTFDADHRIVVFLRAKHSDGSCGYYFDCANSAPNGRFHELFGVAFGSEVVATPGRFVVRPIDSEAFSVDDTLAELLDKFDAIKRLGWINSKRSGDTGIGYTFETLLGIEENNAQTADFNGIELKCKGIKEGVTTDSAKINLFQAGPIWMDNLSARQRIRILGAMGVDGLHSCYSQLTTRPNNLGLLLSIIDGQQKIDLRKAQDTLGYLKWTPSVGQVGREIKLWETSAGEMPWPAPRTGALACRRSRPEHEGS